MIGEGLRVGYGRADITPEVGGALAGNVVKGGRFSTRLHDRLFARAVHFAGPGADPGVTVVCGDILVITARLHSAVAEAAGVPLERLILSATHTHSGPGGYWAPRLSELFMGPYSDTAFGRLVAGLASAVVTARADPRPATCSAAHIDIAGASANRRRHLGPVDPELTLLRLQPQPVDGAQLDSERPIDIVCFGAHPVIFSERAPEAISADWPGELCRRLEARGSRPMFFQGPVGGLSPLFPEFELSADTHLELMGDVVERGFERAEAALTPIAVTQPRAELLQVPVSGVACRMFPPEMRLGGLAELAVWPLRRWMTRRSREAMGGRFAPVHVLDLGGASFVGTPCDLGVNVALAIKGVLRERGIEYALVGSQCSDYVGYVHLAADYAHVPEKGYRSMGFYENAMSVSGWTLGGAFVEAVGSRL